MVPSRSCKKCAPRVLPYSRGLSSCGLSYLAYFYFFFFGLFGFFCLIPSPSPPPKYFCSLGICTLPWNGVALLSVVAWNGEVCVSAVPFSLLGTEMRRSKEVPIQALVGIAGPWHGYLWFSPFSRKAGKRKGSSWNPVYCSWPFQEHPCYLSSTGWPLVWYNPSLSSSQRSYKHLFQRMRHTSHWHCLLVPCTQRNMFCYLKDFFFSL